MSKENMIARSKIGYIKLSDETVISLRVVIVDIREGMQKPVGPDLHIAHTTLIKADSPQSLKEKVREKPLPPPTNIHLQKLEYYKKGKIAEDRKHAGYEGPRYHIHIPVGKNSEIKVVVEETPKCLLPITTWPKNL